MPPRPPGPAEPTPGGGGQPSESRPLPLHGSGRVPRLKPTVQVFARLHHLPSPRAGAQHGGKSRAGLTAAPGPQTWHLRVKKSELQGGPPTLQVTLEHNNSAHYEPTRG